MTSGTISHNTKTTVAEDLNGNTVVWNVICYIEKSTLSFMHPIRNQPYDVYVTTINIHVST